MGKRTEKTNTEECDKRKKVRTTSDDEGEKSVSEKSRSTDGKCVSENSTGGNPGVTVQLSQVTTPSRSQEVRIHNEIIQLYIFSNSQ